MASRQMGFAGVFLRTLVLALWTAAAVAAETKPIIIGMDADMSSGAARGGEAIRRGALIAIAEINQRGGLLGGRRLELVIKDHHGVPARSTDNLKELAATPDLVAVLGGVHSPAIIENLKFIHDERLLILVPWAAATPVIDNGHEPNYVFRLSVRDQYAGEFLTGQAVGQGYRRLGLLLEKTGWGRSNETAIKEALARRGLAPVAVQWFHWGDSDLIQPIIALQEAGADAIILVSNAVEGSAAVKAIAQRPASGRLPVFSHWGILSGRFAEMSGDALQAVDLRALSTFSFADAKRKPVREVLRRYRDMFGAASAANEAAAANSAGAAGTVDSAAIPAEVGTAHAYDLIHVLALAIKKAGNIDRASVRTALEHVDNYAGLIRDYRPPFTHKRHEALTADDFRLVRYRRDGSLVTAERARP